MAIQAWKKVGEPRTLAGQFGKKLISQPFINPETGHLEEFALFSQRDWSVVLAITKDGDVLVVTQFKQGCDCVIDELPAGTADFKDEAPEVVAARELRQETGYVAMQMIPLGYGWIATRSSTTRFNCFLALDCEKTGPTRLDANEYIDTRLVPLDDWITMVMSGEISEPSAVMATMRALTHLDYKITRTKRR